MPKAASRDRQGFYLIDENKAAQIETLRFAMRGLSELIYGALQSANPLEEGKALPTASRENLAALVDVLEQRLGEVVGIDSLSFAWVDQAEVAPAVHSAAEAARAM